jgi:hypothetical protein
VFVLIKTPRNSTRNGTWNGAGFQTVVRGIRTMPCCERLGPAFTLGRDYKLNLVKNWTWWSVSIYSRISTWDNTWGHMLLLDFYFRSNTVNPYVYFIALLLALLLALLYSIFYLLLYYFYQNDLALLFLTIVGLSKHGILLGLSR